MPSNAGSIEVASTPLAGSEVRVKPRTAGTWLVAVVVFTVVCAGSWAWFVWRDRIATLDEARTRTGFVASLFADQTDRAIAAGDQVLAQIAELVSGWDMRDATVGGEIRAQMRRLIEGDQRIVSVWIVDSAGRLTLDNRDVPPPPLELSHRDYYRVHREADRGLFVGNAEIGAMTGRTRFTLSRGIRGPDGSLRAVVTAGISGDYFSALAASSVAGLGPESGVAVFSKRRELLAQAPSDRALGREIFDAGSAEADAAQTRTGAYVVRAGGKRRVIAYAGKSEFVTAVATLPVDEILVEWLFSTSRSGAILLAAIIAFCLVAARGVRLAGGQATALARLRELNSELDNRVREHTAKVQARTAELEAIIETVPAVVMFTYGRDAGSMSANRYGQRLLRIPAGIVPSRVAPGDVGPKSFQVRKNGMELAPKDLPMQRAARGEEVIGEEVELVFDDGTSCNHLVNAAGIRDAEGTPVGAVAIAIDITERKRMEEELRAKSAELEMVLDTVPAVVFIVHGRDAEYISYSRHGQELLRRGPGRHRSRMAPEEREKVQFTIRQDGKDQTPDSLPLHRAARGEAVGDEEIEVVFDDGTSVTLLLHAAPIRNAFGEPVGAVGAAIDITERKHADDRRKLIMAELDHRVRNTLATIQSILTLAEKGGQSKAEFAAAVRGRVDALARAHGLLIETQWRGASLTRLVMDELQPYLAGDFSRLDIVGTDLLLQPKAAVLLALVIHELATNAAKYGALAVRQGRIEVEWKTVGSGTDKRLHWSWRETGGPRVDVPLRRGFGSKVLEATLAAEFDAGVSLDFASEGVRYSAEIPVNRVAADALVPLVVESAIQLARAPERSGGLEGARILLVEDDALIGLEMKDGLEEAGATILGPVARLDRALALAAGDGIDAAVLDVNLGGERVFPLADLLTERHIPFAFLTGYDRSAVFPDRYRGAPALQKPVSRIAVAAMVERLRVRQGTSQP